MEEGTADTRNASQVRLIIVSNRLPVVLHKEKDGRWSSAPGSGGLVTAMAPVMRNRGGVWIGWPGTTGTSGKELEDVLANATLDSGFTLKAVAISQEEKDKYYCGFANEISWPLFHDFPSRCNFDPSYWTSYQTVNQKFALVIKRHLAKGDYVWVHDYHLINVAKELRRLGVDNNMGFFLHIPFPSLDIFFRMPWRFQLLRSLLDYDLIGFQTLRDRRNFIQCVRTLIKDIHIQGKGQVIVLRFGDRDVRVGAFPISIDFKEFSNMAATKYVSDQAWYVHEKFPDVKIILGVDRLDYTKGILERLQAFRNALLRYPELQERVVLVQVVVPSRREIPEYQQLKTEIERLVGEVNGQFTRAGWAPVHYVFRSLDRKELVSYYRTAEIALVTPLKDGMNLIAKEYCAASLEENGVLILSEFAGGAAELQKGAILVNPHDIEGVADAIYKAFKLSREERRQRMKRLRGSVKRRDIYWWVDSFLQAAFEKRLDNFPVIDDYLPQIDIGRS
jgi:trehalose 6-phosphate synthase/phosphatase